MKTIIPWKRGKGENALSPISDCFNGLWDEPWDFSVPSFVSPFGKKQPTVDVSEDKESYTVRVEIPGITEKDMDLTWHEGILTITGEKKEEKKEEEKKKGRYHQECSYGYFSRSVPLGKNVNWEKTVAQYKNC